MKVIDCSACFYELACVISLFRKGPVNFSSKRMGPPIIIDPFSAKSIFGTKKKGFFRKF